MFYGALNNTSAFDININNSSYENNRWRIGNYTVDFGDTKMLEIEAAITGITVKIDDVVCGPMVPKNQDVFETAGNCTILKGVGDALPNEHGVVGRLYSFSIQRGGERVLDLVPARSGDKVGMFDFVSGELLENAGSGSFVAGPEADGELAIAAAPTSFGARSEDAFDPAVGSVFLLTGETKVCRAFPVTDLCGQVGAVPVFYTLEEFDEKLNAYLPPVTNFETVCEYTQGEKYTRVRLTWHWADKTTLRVGAIKNGTMLVNGVPLDDCARRILPPGYVRLDYVESKGQSWVDSKVTLKSPSDRVYMKYTFANDANDKGGVLFGSRVTHLDRCFMAHYNNCVSSLSVTIDSSDNSNNVLNLYNFESLHNFQGTTLEFDASINSISAWCNARNAKATIEPKRKDTFETAGTCMLFKGVKSDVEGSTLPNENVAFGRLHAFRILRDGVYIVDFVPVLNSDGVAGLYDFARGRFFRSEGTADFLPGPEMSEVYVGQDASVTLTAKGNFRRWVGDVTEAEANSNPLVKHLEGWETITPKISAGIIIVVR